MSESSILSFEDFVRLQALEDEIFYCGVDGGATDEDIAYLEKVERELGVFRDGAGGSRWQDYQVALDRLNMK